MFTPFALTVPKTMWLTLKHAGHTYTCSILFHSFCVKAISRPNSARHELRNSYRSSVMCQLLFQLNKNWTLINFVNLPIKNAVKICRGAWVLICRHIQTNKHTKAKRHIFTTFHYKYAKKITRSFLEMLPGIIFSGGATKVYAKPH